MLLESGIGNRWYEEAIIYAIDVKNFKDSNGDGLGDIQGIIDKLDYLADLGVNCLWLLPMYPSSQRDNGYAITDYFSIRPELGGTGRFVELLGAAERKGIRVIIDLVLNHTSKEHPWFKASRTRTPRYTDYYIWTDDPSRHEHQHPPAFPGIESSVWTKDPVRKQHYYHTFYAEQPDLNLANPEVVAELCRIIEFWTRVGVSGFRIDAATPMTLQKMPSHTNTFDVFRRLRETAAWRRGDTALFGEVDDEPGKLTSYVGPQTMHGLFNFILSSHLFLAFAQEDADPIRKVFETLPSLPEHSKYINFLRNLDELNLSPIPNDARDEVFAKFAPRSEHQIYGRGIRRRLAPILQNDQRRIELAQSLLLSLPGIPVLIYGDEIGMGDLLSLPERESVRTAMQWDTGPNAGFSTASGEDVRTPIITSGEYASKHVNVKDQRAKEGSLLNKVRTLIRLRKQCTRGEYRILDLQNRRVFAAVRIDKDEATLFVHNLSGRTQHIDLPVGEVLCGSETLGPYRYQWRKVRTRDLP